jgi:hypothetical protein
MTMAVVDTTKSKAFFTLKCSLIEPFPPLNFFKNVIHEIIKTLAEPKNSSNHSEKKIQV